MEYVLLVHECHLHVQLGELWLAVRPSVLVPIATSDLEVSFHAAYHQHLLVELGRLRQGVERPGHDPRGHQEIPGPLLRAPCQCGGLHFDEIDGVEMPSDGGEKGMSEPKVGHHVRTSKVEVAIFQAKVFAGQHGVLLIGDLERYGLGGVQHLCLLDEHLHLPGGVALILGTRHPVPDHARNGNDILSSDIIQLLAQSNYVHVRLVRFWVKYGLGRTHGIGQVDEPDPTMVPIEAHPASEPDPLAYVLGAKASTILCLHHAHCLWVR